jgi:hypothetical protein
MYMRLGVRCRNCDKPSQVRIRWHVFLEEMSVKVATTLRGRKAASAFAAVSRPPLRIKLQAVILPSITAHSPLARHWLGPLIIEQSGAQIELSATIAPTAAGSVVPEMVLVEKESPTCTRNIP